MSVTVLHSYKPPGAIQYQLKVSLSIVLASIKMQINFIFLEAILLLLKLRLLLLLNVLIREKLEKNCTILPNDFKQCLNTKLKYF